jgi:hypothetical protein
MFRFYCGCEKWFPTLREEHELRVLESSRGIFGPTRDEVTEQLRILCDEELRDFYTSVSIFGA